MVRDGGAVAPAHHGVVVPMASPFTDDGRVDDAAIRRLLDHILDAGVAGVLLLGTTGEAASMSRGERLRLVKAAVNHVSGCARIYAGITDNSLDDTVGAAHAYHRIGVPAFVAHLPCYYPLGAAEMTAWYERLADSLPGPLFLYNIPMTTRMSVPVDVVEALSAHPNIGGIKDSEYDDERMGRILESVRHRDDFAYFVGPSVMALRGLELGADGFVPGIGNVLPDACQALYDAFRAGDTDAAERAQQRMKAIGDTYQAGRPVAHGVALLKTALHALGLCGPAVLPPLVLLDEAERKHVAAAVAALAPRASHAGRVEPAGHVEPAGPAERPEA